MQPLRDKLDWYVIHQIRFQPGQAFMSSTFNLTAHSKSGFVPSKPGVTSSKDYRSVITGGDMYNSNYYCVALQITQDSTKLILWRCKISPKGKESLMSHWNVTDVVRFSWQIRLIHKVASDAAPAYIYVYSNYADYLSICNVAAMKPSATHIHNSTDLYSKGIIKHGSLKLSNASRLEFTLTRFRGWNINFLNKGNISWQAQKEEYGKTSTRRFLKPLWVQVGEHAAWRHLGYSRKRSWRCVVTYLVEDGAHPLVRGFVVVTGRILLLQPGAAVIGQRP